MGTLSDMRTWLQAQVGKTEDPPNSNCTPYSLIAAHAPCQAWCATVLVAGARQTGLRLPSESAWTPAMAVGFQRAGRWHSVGQTGDFGFIDFPGDSKRRIQHVVWIIGRRTNGSYDTYEGNTSSGYSGSQDNGGGFYRRVRAASLFVGFGRPAYTTPARPAPVPEEIPVPATIRKGDSGQSVRLLQGALIAHAEDLALYISHGRLEDFVSGVFDQDTHDCLRIWQERTQSLAADGIAGPKTWDWLLRV